MSLVTREEKGSKLTIQEMDGNLTYLENLTEVNGIVDTARYTSLAVTTEQILSMNLIPAGTFKDLDAVKLDAYLSHENANTGFGFYVKAYINTIPSLEGANKYLDMAPAGSFDARIRNIFMDSFISVLNNGKIKGVTQYGTGVKLELLKTWTGLTSSEFDFNPSVDNYLIVTVTLVSMPDSITQESLVFKKIN